jgi:hypothetical protein
MQSTVTVADPLVKSWKDDIYTEEKQSPSRVFLNPKQPSGAGNYRSRGIDFHRVGSASVATPLA